MKTFEKHCVTYDIIWCSSHEGELLVDVEQRSLVKVFRRRHRRVVGHNLALQFGKRHQRLRQGEETQEHYITIYPETSHKVQSNTRKGNGKMMREEIKDI